MKYYTLKFNDESLNDVFSGSDFKSCMKKSKKAVKKWADALYDEVPYLPSYQIIELDIKVVEKVKRPR